MSKREQEVISLLYGIGERSPKTYEEVASLLHAKLAHIKRIEQKGLRQLRQPPRVQIVKRWIDRLPILEKEATADEVGEELCVLTIDAPILIVSASVTRGLFAYFAENPERLYSLTSSEFEKFIADIWYRFGYEVELTSRTRDGGRDIIAIKHAESLVRYLIECKRYSKDQKVGVVPVRALYGVKEDEGATKAILATTSCFTEEALSFFERHRWELEGRDYEGILMWLRILKEGRKN